MKGNLGVIGFTSLGSEIRERPRERKWARTGYGWIEIKCMVVGG